ncbi:hypothetical protein ACFLVR_04250 [Chloroflexota bacterium]
MVEPRQRPIPVTSEERRSLDKYKQQYEKETGNTGDWGDFLGAIALLGLAALGIYALSKVVVRSEDSVDVRCAECSQNFIMAVPKGIGPVVRTTCPNCKKELLVDMRT